MKVTKEVTFDSAHMLSRYSGKCSNLHGHTYKLQVTFEGTPIGDPNDNECDMVMDFNTMKQYIDCVLNSFDHAIIFSDPSSRTAAEEALFDWADKFNMNYVVVTGKSTSENIATYIKGMLEDLVNMQNLKVSVRLWETPTSFAEV